jgi:hypothetical protein
MLVLQVVVEVEVVVDMVRVENNQVQAVVVDQALLPQAPH